MGVIKKTLYLLRGLPGSGKSTLAKSIGGEHYEADSYFMVYRDLKLVKLLTDTE
jgi:ABC-type molybdenum transport system ATPase subunit/photorepair protein PhrA